MLRRNSSLIKSVQRRLHHINDGANAPWDKSSAVAQMGDRGLNRHGPKSRGGLLCSLRVGRRSWLPSNRMWPGLRCTSVPTKWHLDPSSRLATIDIGLGRKLGAPTPFSGRGELGPNTMSLGLPTKWHLKCHLDPSRHLDTTNMSRRLGAVSLWGGGSWLPI